MKILATRSLYTLLLVALIATTAFAAPGPRPFAPVQEGFTQDAEMVLPYHPTSLMVKFTDQALKKSTLNLAAEKGAALGTQTGLPSVDALNAEFAVKRISRPYHQPASAALAERLGTDRWFKMELASEQDMVAVAARFAADPSVETASPDWRAFPAAVPNDPYYSDQWGHNNTGQMLSYDWATYSHENGDPVGTPGFDAHAEEAWDKSQGFGDPNVVIAIVDSGVDIDHPDLNLLPGYDFGDNDSNPNDDSAQPGHGTACSGVAAAIANNGVGVAGIAGGSAILPCKIADSGGSMYFSYIQDALYWAADQGADVISMSLGATGLTSDPATDAAIEYAYAAGCVILAATGNENASAISYPAIHPDVMGIGAASPCGDRKRSSSSRFEVNSGVSTDPNGYTCDGERWWGSNYGSTTQDAGGAVDVIAPTILPTTDIGGSGGYASGDYDMWFNGTSCATPYAAGVAALVIGANPTYTNADVWNAMTSTATDVVNVESGTGWDRYSGYGMVNADAAIGGAGPVAPTANFSGAPTSGEYPLTVTFTDASTGSPTSWAWTFGDGGTSTVQNPSHTYTAAGTYSVSLTVTNAEGSDSLTMTDYISVTAPPPPTAAFSGAPTSGSYPLTVAFADESTGSPTSWAWTFGDGGTSTAQNPDHTYNAVGVYTVSLTVTNDFGTDTATMTDYITVTEPGVTTFVTATGETAVSGTVSGTYVATAASDGVNQTITEEVYTGHPVKTYSFLEHEWNFDLPAGGDATFHLEASRTANAEGDDMVFAYSTDGVNWVNVATVSSATEQTFSVNLGTLSGAVTVRVADADRSWGNTQLDAVSVDYIAFELGDVQPTAPTADFAGTPTSGEYPLAVQFTDLSTGDPTAWSWSFGDGGNSTAQNPSHTYNAAGVYTVTLTASNAYGNDTATKTGYITVTEPGSGSTTMHVDAMTVSRVKSGPNYLGSCVVGIVDGDGLAVGGATVTCSYDGATSGTVSGTTAADGTVTLLSSGLKKPSGEWCFEVTNVTHASLTYDAGSNVVTRVCEGGTVYGADAKRVPVAFGLSQNSPNPFNPMTEIAFAVPQDSHVRLRIFNVRGQVVETLVDRTVGAGEHVATWNAANHPSGVYFYRIEAPGFSETRKMVMLK